MERGWKPNVEISPNCPRCGSCNTKFCYYNNYSLTQPRYFCKGCRRYWTKGGSLRNVPVGGGCRKSRRGKSIRISTDRVLSRGGLAYGNPSVEPASSSMVPDGSNIDIAQVYANFLNRPPEPETRPELPSDSDLSFQFASVSNFNTHLQLENGHFECASLSDRFSETQPSDGGAIYGCGFDSIHEQQEIIQQFTTDHVITNYGLPPLPGEEEAPEDMGWSSSQIMVPNHILHMPQLPRIEPEPQHPLPDQVIGNKISSSYGTFFGP